MRVGSIPNFAAWARRNRTAVCASSRASRIATRHDGSPGCSQPGDPSCLVAIREALEDAQTAVRFLRAQAAKFGIDPTRIAIGGSSAGAVTAVNVGYASLTTRATGSHRGFSSAVEAVQSLSG